MDEFCTKSIDAYVFRATYCCWCALKIALRLFIISSNVRSNTTYRHEFFRKVVKYVKTFFESTEYYLVMMGVTSRMYI